MGWSRWIWLTVESAWSGSAGTRSGTAFIPWRIQITLHDNPLRFSRRVTENPIFPARMKFHTLAHRNDSKPPTAERSDVGPPRRGFLWPFHSAIAPAEGARRS